MEMKAGVKSMEAFQESPKQDFSFILAGVTVKEEVVDIKEELFVDENAVFLTEEPVKDELVTVKPEADFLECFGEDSLCRAAAPGDVKSFIVPCYSESVPAATPGSQHPQGLVSPAGGGAHAGHRASNDDSFVENLGVLSGRSHVENLSNNGSRGSYFENVVLRTSGGGSHVEKLSSYGSEGSSFENSNMSSLVKTEPESDWPFERNPDVKHSSAKPDSREQGCKKKKNKLKAVSAILDKKSASLVDEPERKMFKYEEVEKGELCENTPGTFLPHDRISNKRFDSSELTPPLKCEDRTSSLVTHNGSHTSANGLNLSSQDSRALDSRVLYVTAEASENTNANLLFPETSVKQELLAPSPEVTLHESERFHLAAKDPVLEGNNSLNARKSRDRGAYECKLCSFTCNSVSAFLGHSKQHKKKQVTHAFECRGCDFSCSDIKVFLAHTKDVCKVVQEDEPCSVASKGGGHSKGGLPPASDGNVYCCEYCDFETHNTGFILRHIALHVKEEKSNSGAFECSSCDYTSRDRDQFLRHVERHKGIKTEPITDTPPLLNRPTRKDKLDTQTDHNSASEENQSSKLHRTSSSRIRVGSTRKRASFGLEKGRHDTASVTMTTGPGAGTNNAVVFVRQHGSIGVLVGSGDNVNGVGSGDNVNGVGSSSELRNNIHCDGSIRGRNAGVDTTFSPAAHPPRKINHVNCVGLPGLPAPPGGGAGQYTCSKCAFTCTNARTFRVHVTQCWRGGGPVHSSDGSFQCSLCPFKTKDTKYFLDHVRTHA